MTRLAHELDLATGLARDAAAVVLEVKAGAALGVEMKAGDEPVTIADRRASELVVRGLRAAFPADVVISEESDDDLARLTAPRVWYVDPIDGTRDFIAGRAGFAVMIGLAIGHVPTLGVVLQPEGNNLFWAAPGDDGAPASWFRPGDGGPQRRMRVSDVRNVAQIRLVASASHRTSTIDDVKNALGISSEINVGSVGLKLALISLGERDLYVNPSAKSKLWDVCAPEVILRGAGGELTDAHGARVRYDQRDLACKSGLVASNGHVHAAVIARLAQLFPR
jgi:3'(2'), 5'-bisphosphate nucleotidase